MSTQNTAPDFGEPWEYTTFRNCIRDRHNTLRQIEDDLRDRSRVCVNACQGMADPAAEIERLKLAQSRALDAADVLQNVEDERNELRRDVSALLNALPNGAHDVTEGVVSIRAMRATLKEASSHLSGFLGFHADSLTTPQMRSISECLAKLQPYAKP